MEVRTAHNKSAKSDHSIHLVKVKIPTEFITIGMTVIQLDRDWEEVPVVFQDFTIESQNDAEILKNHCKYVYIELEQDYWDTVKHIYPITHAQPIHPEAVKLQKEYPRAKEVYENVKNENAIDIAKSKDIVNSCIESIFANPNAMFWLSRIKHQDAYTAEHCLRVCILSIAFGHYLELSREEVAILGLAGMLHDVGKMKISQSIINKPGPLNDIEFKLMKEHTTLGYRYLTQHSGIDEAICKVAIQHHERIDGNGYPQNLAEDQISLFSKIIAIIDCYDAVTSVRSYRSAYTPLQALNIIYKEKNTHFDETLVKKFIEMIGVYPPGSLVEMSNGETGIVLSSNPDNKLKPKVEIIIDSDGILRRPIVIDLTRDNFDENKVLYEIKKPLTDEDITVNLDGIIKEIH